MCNENTAFPVWYAHDRTCNNRLIFLNTRRIIKLRSCRHPSVKSKGQSPAWKTDCAICGGRAVLTFGGDLVPSQRSRVSFSSIKPSRHQHHVRRELLGNGHHHRPVETQPHRLLRPQCRVAAAVCPPCIFNILQCGILSQKYTSKKWNWIFLFGLFGLLC